VTGPLAFLLGGVIDVVSFAIASLRVRVRARVRVRVRASRR
jgi:hypothetical protein